MDETEERACDQCGKYSRWLMPVCYQVKFQNEGAHICVDVTIDRYVCGVECAIALGLHLQKLGT